LPIGRKIPASEVRVMHPDAVGDAGYSNRPLHYKACQQSLGISRIGFAGRGPGMAGIFDFSRDISPPIKLGFSS
jgi:hypothetical protein